MERDHDIDGAETPPTSPASTARKQHSPFKVALAAAVPSLVNVNVNNRRDIFKMEKGKGDLHFPRILRNFKWEMA